VLAIVCPGQGSQTPGMLAPWLDLPGVAAHLERLAEASGTDLRAHGTTSDADTIRDTAVAQPLIVASSLVSAHAVDPRLAASAGVLAGHSVGEFAAAALAGVLTEDDALALVAVRGAAMATAASVTPTGMSAVVGGDPEEVLSILESLGLTPANVNGGGQVVAAGDLDSLAALAAHPPSRARVIPLPVAGAFHTTYMLTAREQLRGSAAALSPRDPVVPLLSNRDGSAVSTAAEALAALVAQVAHPVRWDLCQEMFAAIGVTGMLELAPGGVLTGLARRSLPGVETVALKTPDDLDAARALVARHSEEAPHPQENDA
jgi:[acyl-carrier-protein] S-malonyltransferase